MSVTIRPPGLEQGVTPPGPGTPRPGIEVATPVPGTAPAAPLSGEGAQLLLQALDAPHALKILVEEIRTSVVSQLGRIAQLPPAPAAGEPGNVASVLLRWLATVATETRVAPDRLAALVAEGAKRASQIVRDSGAEPAARAAVATATALVQRSLPAAPAPGPAGARGFNAPRPAAPVAPAAAVPATRSEIDALGQLADAVHGALELEYGATGPRVVPAPGEAPGAATTFDLLATLGGVASRTDSAPSSLSPLVARALAQVTAELPATAAALPARSAVATAGARILSALAMGIEPPRLVPELSSPEQVPTPAPELLARVLQGLVQSLAHELGLPSPELASAPQAVLDWVASQVASRPAAIATVLNALADLSRAGDAMVPAGTAPALAHATVAVTVALVLNTLATGHPPSLSWPMIPASPGPPAGRALLDPADTFSGRSLNALATSELGGPLECVRQYLSAAGAGDGPSAASFWVYPACRYLRGHWSSYADGWAGALGHLEESRSRAAQGVAAIRIQGLRAELLGTGAALVHAVLDHVGLSGERIETVEPVYTLVETHEGWRLAVALYR
jgi:hypothetical protein